MLALRLGAILLAALAVTAACSSSETGSGGGGGQGGATSSSGGPFGGGTSTASGADAGPLICPQGYTTIPKGECDLLQQDCPPGQTCRANDDTAPSQTACQTDTGLKGLGEDCKVNSECQAGLLCVNQCTSACCRTSNEPCGGGQCNLQLNYQNGDYVFVCAFDTTCHLLQPNACPTGQTCHVADITQGLTSCNKPSSTMVGDLGTCTYLNDCPDMEDCHLDTANTKHCHFYCYTEMSRGEGTPGRGGCPVGQSCQTTESGMPIDEGLPGIGLCFPN